MTTVLFLEAMNDVRLLRPIEVARLLAVSRSEVYRLIAQGRLPSVRLSERVVRVPLRELEAFLRARTQGGCREDDR
ncbi:MAG TPA: helix-turn-helix domain-containing protein [Actinomycetota bacterium]|nr:helix-turn-helix domain-containing protein [Actinomycetota bacterium]